MHRYLKTITSNNQMKRNCSWDQPRHFTLEMCFRGINRIVWSKTILQIAIIILVILAIAGFMRDTGIYNYEHIPRCNVEKNLYRARCPKLRLDPSLPKCEYNFIGSPESIGKQEIGWRIMEFKIEGISNGSFVPSDCTPAFSTAILVTFRNRKEQLETFIPYIHSFMKYQGIHYKIFVIEQQDDKPWNKGLLYNVGARVAMDERFPCLILHDVDLLPLDTANIYACTYYPRHMSASIDKFSYALPYLGLIGGVAAITSRHYSDVNGFSNKYEYWGGEDDDFARRLERRHLEITRFAPEMSRYTMLRHPQEKVNPQRFEVLRATDGRQREDGLSTARYSALTVHHHQLYTLLAVKS